MRIRSRLTMLGVAAVMAAAGPWTGASADDWPAPGGDPFAGQGTVVADVSLPSTGGVGFKLTLPTGGLLDLLGWIDTGSPAAGGGSAADDMTAIGGIVWNLEAPPPRPNMWFLFPQLNSGPDLRAQAAGVTVLDQRGSGGTDLWEGVGGGAPNFPAGTYQVIIWAATNSPNATTRFRLHAATDATLLNQTVSTTAYLRGLRQFSGTAVAAIDAPSVAASASLAQSTSVDVTHTLYGGFNVGGVSTGVPAISAAHYTDPDGVSHPVSSQAMFNGGTPSGTYTFTLDHHAWTTEPFVAGVDLVAP